MTAKLIKKKEGWYNLYNGEIGIGSTHEELQLQGYKLSLKNCQAIERDYDLDELANKEYLDGYDTTNLCRLAFKDGFQKALEILGDKKFSEDDIRKVVNYMFEQIVVFGNKVSALDVDRCIQSLQQTEWDVEIEMEKVKDETKIVGAVKGVKGSGNKITTYKSVPKLDATGCLILKLKL